MQNVDLICVGRLSARWYAEAVAEYQKRLAAFCTFRIVELPEAPLPEKNLSPALIEKALAQEGAAILKARRKGAFLAALCVEGKPFSSEELAALLKERALRGAGDIAFVIGSSHGLAESVKQAADARLSLGRITLPHQLARVVVCEQLYRACTINAGMRYHK